MNMRKEYDFSKGERGKFYHQDIEATTYSLIVMKEVSAFVEKIASKKGIDRSSVVNELLRGDMKFAKANQIISPSANPKLPFHCCIMATGDA